MSFSGRCHLLALLVLAIAVPTRAQVDARLLRHPDVSETHVTFVYAGDVWTVPVEGGTAVRLSSPPGEETYPRFSPNGQHIAFTGNYDGNEDVYVLPTGGGTPIRLTHHPTTDRVLDWTPDGEQVLYASNMESGRKRYNQIFRVDEDGGMPQKLPVPYGEFGVLSADGETLAFTTKTRQFSTWKRYRGGQAADIWLFNVNDETAERVTDHPANDEMPMWAGRTLYFLSDRGPAMRYNLWAYDTQSKQMRQVTTFIEVDVHSPAIGPSHIVFEAGGQLHLLDLSDETHAPMDVDVVTDYVSLKPRAETVEGYTRSATVSPSGKRVIVEARGELFSLPAEHGILRTISQTPGAAERYPQWSLDGSEVAYWTDRNDNWQLAVRPADGSGEEELLTEATPGYRYPVTWSPNGSKLAYRDETRTLYVIDRETGEQTAVDQDRWSLHRELLGETVSWSSDGRWLAYDRYMDNGHQAVFLFDTQNGESQQVTSGFYSAHHPVFDPDGNHLYLLTNRELSPSYSDLQPTWVYANTTRIAAVPLRNDVDSPLHPRNDTEPDTEPDSEDAGEEGESNGENNEEASEAVEVDLADFERRMVLLPPEAGRYADLQATSGKVVYRRLPRTGSGEDTSPLVFYDLEAREEQTVLDDASQAQVAGNGMKVLIQQRGQWAIIDLAPEQSVEKPLRTGEMEMTVHPREEWRQMFDEAWRLYRDWFYDPEFHQVDWDAMHEQYGALLDDAVTRWDVNFVIGELIGEVNASHTYRGGGDTPDEPRRGTGLLGVEWSLENGAYRIHRIYRGAPWDDAEVRSPLDEPGVNVDAGTYVLAVNGVPLDTGADPWAVFAGLDSKTVELTVNDQPTAGGARTVLVKMLSGPEEVRLQYLDWVNGMRERVDEASEGGIGYVYVPNTGGQGQTELVRQFVAQTHKDGLIIDERFNSGGQLGDRFMELLNRPIYSYIAPRHGPPAPWPPFAHTGPQAMLINGWSGSGGDAFPWYFQQAERGPVIGTRTWGGLIGPAVGHRLVDNGVVVVPPARLFGPDGAWFAEGHGVEPDIAVPEDPGALARGTDRQLERAIEEVMNAIEANPPQRPPKPPYVDRWRPENQ